MHPQTSPPPQNSTPAPSDSYPSYLSYESYQSYSPMLVRTALPAPDLATNAGSLPRIDGFSPSCDQLRQSRTSDCSPRPSEATAGAPFPGSSVAPSLCPSFPPSLQPLPLSALAAMLGCTRSTVRHFADRLGFRFTVRRIGPRHKRAACLTPNQCNAIAAEVDRDAAAYRSPSSSSSSSSSLPCKSEATPGVPHNNPTIHSSNNSPRNLGLFYLLQLEPEKDPGRIKLGFTADLESRLDDLLTAAPYARCVAAWPAYRSWERMAIVATSQVATQIRQEVYHCENIQNAVAAANAFFAALPKLSHAIEAPLSRHAQQSPGAPRSGGFQPPTPPSAEGNSHPCAHATSPPRSPQPPPAPPPPPAPAVKNRRSLASSVAHRPHAARADSIISVIPSTAPPG